MYVSPAAAAAAVQQDIHIHTCMYVCMYLQQQQQQQFNKKRQNITHQSASCYCQTRGRKEAWTADFAHCLAGNVLIESSVALKKYRMV
jgi:hypothetical protein